MVVKIQSARATMAGTLLYNQRKVEGGVARILCAVNIPSAFPEDIRDTFSRYEKRNRSSDCVSFQLSINPDPFQAGERLSDQEVREFASALMNGLGYGSQPYVVYEHRDIDRTHYHVVSIRTNWEGKKINDYREIYRCQQLLKQNAQQFHYKVGKENGSKKRPGRTHIGRFDPKSGDICNQYLSLFREATEYRFSTIPQLKAICASKGLIMDTRDTPTGPDIVIQGAGPDGKPVARVISGQEMKEDLYGLFESKVHSNKYLKPVSIVVRSRIARAVSDALARSRSEDTFVSMLARRGIHASVFRSRKGGIYGATFVDDWSKTVLRGSELPGITTSAYREADTRWRTASLKEVAAVLTLENSSRVLEEEPTRTPSYCEGAREDYDSSEIVVEEREVDTVDAALGVASGVLGRAGDFGSASKDDSKVFRKKKQRIIRKRH